MGGSAKVQHNSERILLNEYVAARQRQTCRRHAANTPTLVASASAFPPEDLVQRRNLFAPKEHTFAGTLVRMESFVVVAVCAENFRHEADELSAHVIVQTQTSTFPDRPDEREQHLLERSV